MYVINLDSYAYVLLQSYNILYTLRAYAECYCAPVGRSRGREDEKDGQQH